VTDQPALCDRPIQTGPILVGGAASPEEGQVDKFDGNPLLVVGLSSVGKFDELTGSIVRVTERSVGDEFHGGGCLSGLEDCEVPEVQFLSLSLADERSVRGGTPDKEARHERQHIQQ
jgi:hypothetical protein